MAEDIGNFSCKLIGATMQAMAIKMLEMDSPYLICAYLSPFIIIIIIAGMRYAYAATISSTVNDNQFSGDTISSME